MENKLADLPAYTNLTNDILQISSIYTNHSWIGLNVTNKLNTIYMVYYVMMFKNQLKDLVSREKQ